MKGNVQTQTNQRDHGIDCARGISIFLVVLSHVVRKGIITDYCAAAGVAAFFYLSGCVYKCNGCESYQDRINYWINRLRRLYLPYIIVSLISIAIYSVLGEFAGNSLGVKNVHQNILQMIWNMLYGSSKNGAMKWNESLWFIPCYLIVLVFINIIMKLKRREVILAASVLLFMAGEFLVRKMNPALPWQIETACHLQILMILGILTGKKIKAWGAAALSAASAGTFVISVFAMRLLGSLSLRQDEYPNMIPSAAVLIASVIWITAVGELLAGLKDRIFSALGRKSFEIMLWNKFPVLAFQVLLPVVWPAVKKFYPERNDIIGLVVSAVVSSICCTLCFVWIKICQKFIKY